MQFLRGQKIQVAPKHTLLRDELQTMVSEKQLFPNLRIEYTRIAFQPETHDHVRVSVDVNMRYSVLYFRSDRVLFCLDSNDANTSVTVSSLVPHAV